MRPRARFCARSFSPWRHFGQVPDQAVQQALRQTFTQWGRPQTLRVDNGKPWGSWSDLPPALALWVLGLDIAVHYNPPRRPEHNGVVERSHQTAQNWAEPSQCTSLTQLQQRLDDDDVLQRQQYPYAGQTRWQVYPALVHSGRSYREATEEALWQLAAV